SRRTDFLNCIHRDVFKSVHWPTDRSREDLFQFEVARRFRTKCQAEVVAVIHGDAAERFTDTPGSTRVLTMAPDLAPQLARLRTEHGDALRRWAPATFARFVRSAAINYYLSGRRKTGWRYARTLVRDHPLSSSGWSVLLVGLLNRRTLAVAVAGAK